MRTAAIIIIVFAAIYSCTSGKKDRVAATDKIIAITDTSLGLQNGTWCYGKQPFSGTIMEYWPGGQCKSSRQIKEGKENGLQQGFFENGTKEYWRWYTYGEKDSVHTSWWPNGHKRSEYHFKKGNYNGLFTEWYNSGAMLQQVVYADGKEISGKGWRENGKPYMSFVMKDGRRYGLVNANLCYTLVKEEVKE